MLTATLLMPVYRQVIQGKSIAHDSSAVLNLSGLASVGPCNSWAKTRTELGAIIEREGPG
jgi:hypothetical protein